MKRSYKVIYWIATGFLFFAMLAGGIQQLLQIGGYVEIVVDNLGYPMYFLSILGTWKILGVIVLLMPRLPVVKEWAYAGFFFAMSGAMVSHISMGQGFGEIFPSLILLIVTVISWYFRPPDRRIISSKKMESFNNEK